METFYVKTKHPVHAQLAKLAGISGSKGCSFFGGEIVFPHHGFEIRQGSFNARLIHFKVKEQPAQIVTTHDHLSSLQVAENSDCTLLINLRSEARDDR
jgi:hypothetical protein